MTCGRADTLISTQPGVRPRSSSSMACTTARAEGGRAAASLAISIRMSWEIGSGKRGLTWCGGDGVCWVTAISVAMVSAPVKAGRPVAAR